MSNLQRNASPGHTVEGGSQAALTGQDTISSPVCTCGAPLVYQPGRGRKRQFCCPAHKQAEYRNRSKEKRNKTNILYSAHALTVLKTIDDTSVDCLVTDPPYGYSFMGKDWDKAVPSVDIWKECVRVLKPGAFAFIMSAPRQDVLSQMVVRLSEAGFRTDFTSLYWAYACLSADTEVLTQDGWKSWEQLYKTDRNSKIFIYDRVSKTYKWEVPLRWNYYQVKDTCYRITSDKTDQLVSKGHRCLIEREGKLLFSTPEEIEKAGMESIFVPYLETMPEVQEDISDLARSSKTRKKPRPLLQYLMSSKSKYQEVFTGKWKIQTPNVRETETKTTKCNDGQKELGLDKDGYVMEHRLLVAQQVGRLLKRAEVVHHFDHNPANNSLNNLLLFASNRDHKLHEAGKPIKPLWRMSQENIMKA